MQETKKYFYQPDLTSSIIDWCWTLLILIAGIVVWLEITHFQWISALLFLIFLILTFFAIQRRTVTVNPQSMTFSRLLQRDFLVVPLKDIRQLRFTKHTMTMTVNGEVMTYTFSHRSIVDLQRTLKNAQQGVQ
ncbi:EbsA family protein [uncultured Limosilactobacillus sp.]|uniref:EbsA family protein n=1 Tax=uncultured Limosilactobacillus sp. TaxID=2837629 RepID=UPI0025ED5EBD|nr:EbsA family protein [uncultured Limosilactobacillus sp.]